MMIRSKTRFVTAVLLAMGVVLFQTDRPALAHGGHHHGGGHHHHGGHHHGGGHHHHHHHDDYYGDMAIGGLIGLGVGEAIANSENERYNVCPYGSTNVSQAYPGQCY